MKIKIVMISFLSLLTIQAYAATTTDAHIANAKKHIGSIKNYNSHKERVNKVTNNNPSGMPGVIGQYQTKQHAMYTGKIQDAAEQAKNALGQAQMDANDEQLRTIAVLNNEINAL